MIKENEKAESNQRVECLTCIDCLFSKGIGSLCLPDYEPDGWCDFHGKEVFLDAKACISFERD